MRVRVDNGSVGGNGGSSNFLGARHAQLLTLDHVRKQTKVDSDVERALEEGLGCILGGLQVWLEFLSCGR